MSAPAKAARRGEATGCALLVGIFLGMCLTLVCVFWDMTIACAGSA